MSERKAETANSEDNERPRGLLAPVDRAYLRGEKEYNHRQTAYDREAKIRERLRNGILDLQIVVDEMEDEELEKALGDYSDGQEIWDALTDVVTFVFRVSAIEGMNEDLVGNRRNTHFKEAVEQGARRGYLNHDCVLDEFEMTYGASHIPGLSERIQEGEDVDLSPEFIRLALHDDSINSEPIEKELRQQIREMGGKAESDGPSEEAESNSESDT